MRNVTKKATLSELRTRESRNVAYNSRRKRVVCDVHMRMGRENEKDKDGSRESVEQRRKEKEECRIVI